MKYIDNFFLILLFTAFIAIYACSDKNGLNINVDNSYSLQNTQNLFGFDSAMLVAESDNLTLNYLEPLQFDQDSSLIDLNVRKYSSGSGEIKIFGVNDTTLFSATVNEEQEQFDIELNGFIPQKINIKLQNYYGNFSFLIKGKNDNGSAN